MYEVGSQIVTTESLCAERQSAVRKPWRSGLPGREELINPAMMYDWIDSNTMAR
jgi:hypothetical protein